MQSQNEFQKHKKIKIQTFKIKTQTLILTKLSLQFHLEKLNVINLLELHKS